MKSPKDFETFLNSLHKPEKGQAEDEAKLLRVLKIGADFGFTDTEKFLIKCLRRAESLRVPEGLRESIKEAVMAGMDAENGVSVWEGHDYEEYERCNKDAMEYRALCAPDSPPSETNREEVKG